MNHFDFREEQSIDFSHFRNVYIQECDKKSQLRKALAIDLGVEDTDKFGMLVDLAWQERHESGCEEVAQFVYDWLCLID